MHAFCFMCIGLLFCVCCAVQAMCMIAVSFCMVYSNLDTVLTSVNLRKHVYWLLLSVFKLIFVMYICTLFEFLGSV